MNNNLHKRVEKLLRKTWWSILLTAVLGCLLSVVGFFVLGAGIAVLLTRRAAIQGYLESPQFWLVYTVIFALAMLLGRYYKPKSSYYLGVRRGRTGMTMDDIFTFRDDIDRAHAGLGLLLAIPNFVWRNVIVVWELFTLSVGSCSTPLAMWIIRNCDREPLDIEEIWAQSYPAATKLVTLGLLKEASLIRINREEETCILTHQGDQFLSQRSY